MLNPKLSRINPKTRARNSRLWLLANCCTLAANTSSLRVRANLRPALTSSSYRWRYLGSSLSGIFSPTSIFFHPISVCQFGFLFNILIEKRSPVGDEQSVRVVVSPGNTFELSCRNKLSGEDACSSLDTLATIVGELHLFFVEIDAVTEDAEHGTRTHDIGIKAFLLQRVILGKTCLINQIHGFVHGVFDVLIIWCQSEEVMVEHLHM